MTKSDREPRRRSLLRRWAERLGLVVVVIVIALLAAFLMATAIDLATKIL